MSLDYRSFDITQEGDRVSVPELGTFATLAEAKLAIDAHCETLPLFCLRTKRNIDYGKGYPAVQS